jgi:uncharacterized membrane protein
MRNSTNTTNTTNTTNIANRLWLYFTAFKSVFQYRRHLQARNIEALRLTIMQAEKNHRGEIRLVIEHHLSLPHILSNTSSRQRAIQWFSDLRIWDTEGNTGILLYLLLNEKKIEIVADRGIASQVSQEEWNQICLELQNNLSAQQVEAGITTALHQFGQLLIHHFPHVDNEDNPDELSNAPVIII